MTAPEFRRNVIHGTLSGFARLGFRLALGLGTFRLLFEWMTPEEFGFWSLLWALFGYGILLDFGFGHAAQKGVAELSVRRDWHGLSELLSTLLGFHLAMAVLTGGVAFLVSGPLVELFHVSAANRESFRVILEVFLVGVALAFPLGLFLEVLQGQQRVAVANGVTILSIVSNFVCVVFVVWLDGSFLTLVILTLLCVLVPYMLAAWLALRRLPDVRISPALFSWSVLARTSRFGLYAYLNLLGNVVRHKGDQPIIGTLLGAAAVAQYQPGSRLAEMFGMVTRQIADVLSPAAAYLHARGDSAALRRMLMDGLRFSVLLATPLYLVMAAYFEEILRVLTGLAHPDSEMVWVGQLLLSWYYSLVLTHWVFKRMFLMAGQERRMMWHGVSEAFAGLILGVALTAALHRIEGVAWGALVPTALSGWLMIWGWAAREIGVSRWRLFKTVVGRAWIAVMPMIVVLVALRWQPFWQSGASTPLMLFESGIALLAGGAGTWYLGLDGPDRERIRRRYLSMRATTSRS